MHKLAPRCLLKLAITFSKRNAVITWSLERTGQPALRAPHKTSKRHLPQVHMSQMAAAAAWPLEQEVSEALRAGLVRLAPTHPALRRVLPHLRHRAA